MDIKNILHLDFFQDDRLLYVIFTSYIILIFALITFFILGKINPNSKLKDANYRVRTWIFIMFISILPAQFNTNISYIVISFFSFWSFREIYSSMSFKQHDRKVIFIAILTIPIQYYLAYIKFYELYIIFIPILIFLLLPIVSIIFGNIKGIIKSMALINWALILTVFGLSHMAYLLSLPNIDSFLSGGRGLLIFLIILTKLNDLLNFIFDRLIGRHMMFEKMNIKKTWEGFTVSILFVILIGYFLKFLTPFSVGQVILISSIISVVGFLGNVAMIAIEKDLGIYTSNIKYKPKNTLEKIYSLCYTAPIFFHVVYHIFYL